MVKLESVCTRKAPRRCCFKMVAGDSILALPPGKSNVGGLEGGVVIYFCCLCNFFMTATRGDPFGPHFLTASTTGGWSVGGRPSPFKKMSQIVLRCTQVR